MLDVHREVLGEPPAVVAALLVFEIRANEGWSVDDVDIADERACVAWTVRDDLLPAPISMRAEIQWIADGGSTMEVTQLL